MFIPDQVCPSLQTGTSAVLVGIQDTDTMGWNHQIQSGKTQALQLASLYRNTMGNVCFGLVRIVPWYSWGICTLRLTRVLLFLGLPHRTVRHLSSALPDPDPYRSSERLVI